MNKNVLNLTNKGDGNQIKQGDKSKITFELSDSNNDVLDVGQTAKVYLSKRDYVYQYDATIKENKVDLVINQIIPSGTYDVEVVANGYVFPSDNTVRISVTPSVLGRGLDNIKSANLYDDLIKYGLENGLFDDLKTTQTQIVESVKEDYANSVGELDVMFLDWHDGFSILPFVFTKNDYDSGYGSYEDWKNFKKNELQNLITLNTPNNVEEFHENVKNGPDFRAPFPVQYDLKVDSYYLDVSTRYENNYLIPVGEAIKGERNQIVVRHVFNNNPIEQNKLELDITL
ncbi:hypothetical protein RM611_03535 [Staphylococcus chromogenes]|uniref:hypothetical protein n=1 Tax=Staphylococcus chromogenes TaxID=46126 RepID=UPI0028849D12|nr:hypothetical protein [Staphylococcus chromogenes]MDT0692677.1 hypothetical protein [Staphylococcus chromogenes]MDT0700246.1 hypothetical protein [Staphylococcus chromogenes]